MPPEITFSLRNRYRQHLRDARMNTRQFSIGSAEDDDLPIPDAPLQPRHIVISAAGESVWLEDHGAGGVSINGQPLRGARELKHDDVISLPGDYQLIAHLDSTGGERSYERGNGELAAAASFTAAASGQTASRTTERQSPLRLTLIVAVLLTVLLVFVAAYRKKLTSPPGAPVNVGASPSAPSPLPKPAPEFRPAESDILTTAQTVLRCVCRDAGRYVFTYPEDLRALEERVRLYKGSAQAERALIAVGAQSQRIIQAAQQSDLKNYSALLIYSVLAEVFAQPASNPMDVLKQIQPGISSRRRIFGADKVEDLLLLVATRKAADPSSIRYRLPERDVWKLHRQKQFIGEDEYQYLLNFLALAVIAQEPGKWDIHAQPLKVCESGAAR